MSKFKNITHGRHDGKVVVSKNIVSSIVILSISELKNVKLFYPVKENTQSNPSVKLDYVKKGVLSIQVKVKVYYTDRVSTVSFKVQEAVRHNIETLTDYSVSTVNVIVCGVYFDDEDENINANKRPKNPSPNENEETSINDNEETKTDTKEENKNLKTEDGDNN